MTRRTIPETGRGRLVAARAQWEDSGKTARVLMIRADDALDLAKTANPARAKEREEAIASGDAGRAAEVDALWASECSFYAMRLDLLARMERLSAECGRLAAEHFLVGLRSRD